MAFGKGRKDNGAIDTYDVTYKGGLKALPKAKVGKIKFEIFDDRFELSPTIGSKFWTHLVIPYTSISSFEITDRTVSTIEGLLGGLDSKQLNQKNNIHIAFTSADGPTILRLEMLSGVTVMGQAKKCNELIDRLRTHGILDLVSKPEPSPAANDASLGAQIAKLAELRDSGVLSEDEFTAAKARLLT